MILSWHRPIASWALSLRVFRVRQFFFGFRICARPGFEWLLEWMLRNQTRDGLHHAPMCPGNEWAGRALVTLPCNCGAAEEERKAAMVKDAEASVIEWDTNPLEEWSVHESGTTAKSYTVVTKEREIIAIPRSDREKSRAFMVAAAPDLLAAARIAVNTFEIMGLANSDDKVLATTERLLRKAIEKATATDA